MAQSNKCIDCGKKISKRATRCRKCNGKRHSNSLEEQWKNGVYDNRDESYRTDEEYRKQVSNTVKKRWEEGVYGEERNEKISRANKGNHDCGKTGRKDYKWVCRICGEIFITKNNSYRSVCDKKTCQQLKGEKLYKGKKPSEKTKKKISKAMKGKMPKNLEHNINLKDSPPQRNMFKTIKKYFNQVKYNYYIETKNTKRYLDVALPKLKIDFEYDGKIHLSEKIKEKDKIRDKELKEIGWKAYRFNKDNIDKLEDVLNYIKKQKHQG